MSRTDPMMRFLGVRFDADELDLLGIEPTYISAAGIDAALASRLASVYDHPDGRSADAEMVCKLLRDAADRLRDENIRSTIIAEHTVSVEDEIAPAAASAPVPSKEAVPAVSMTPLQERLLTILAGSGGWNPQSRARLSSVAATEGLTPEGLMTELAALGRGMRSGLRAAPKRTASAASVASRALEPGFLERVIDEYAPELRGDDRRSILKMCLLFAGIGLLGLVLMIRFLFPELDPGMVLIPRGDVAVVGTTSSKTFDGGFDATMGGQEHVVPALTFTDVPVIEELEVSQEVLDASDASAETVREIDAFSRQLIGIQELEPAMLETWSSAVETASTGWFITEPATAQAMRGAIQRVIDTSGANPTVFQSLQRTLAPKTPFGQLSPLDLPRGAWSAGMTSMVAMSDTTSPAVRANAVALLRIGLGQNATPSGFDAAAASWLEASVPDLVEGMETNKESETSWSLWLASLDALSDQQAAQHAIVLALESLLRTETDLSRKGPSQRILGSLLVAIDWSTYRDSRTAISGLFDDSNISSSDLWVLSSMLVHLDSTSSWFKKGLVLSPDADAVSRRLARDRLLAAWPAEGSTPLQLEDMLPEEFDPALAETWLSVCGQVQSLPGGKGDIPVLQRILMDRLLQEAAVDLLLSSGQRVLSTLNEVEGLVEAAMSGKVESSTNPGIIPTLPGGQVDGDWSDQYREAKSKTDKFDILHALEIQSAEELGPLDASCLAGEAMTASTDIRESAQYVIERRFAESQNVIMALVDRFPSMKSKARDVSGFIESITGEQLPRTTSTQWPLQARLALVNHAIELQLGNGMAIDEIGEMFAESLQREAESLGRSAQGSLLADDAATQLTTAWQDHLDLAIRAGGLPLGWVDRRAARARMSVDRLQRCLAERIATAELINRLIAAQVPSMTSQIENHASNAARGRSEAGHVLEQLGVTERSLVEAWKARINRALESSGAREKGGGA
ncbi:MAG: hypothetical protein VX908_01975 [Planctomycetota bacterium]|nr:hypothetical protein [Planctomycetota bacterium]